MKFVQFMHPGKQPPKNIMSRSSNPKQPSCADGLGPLVTCPPNQGPRHWRNMAAEGECLNSKTCINQGCKGSHWRKFMAAEGEWLDSKASIKQGCMTFWGEWEQQSLALPLNGTHSAGMPTHVHFPICVSPIGKPADEDEEASDAPESCGNLPGCGGSTVLSTDPFVFCKKGFLFLHCRIVPNGALAGLVAGDIVAFGSHLQGNFVLDTLFVVKDKVSVDSPMVCQEFRAMNAPYLGNSQPLGGNVYLGASMGNSVNGMFSFFPARPYDDNGQPIPFRRPILRPIGALRGLISPKLAQNFKISSSIKSKPVWDEIVKQVRRSHCELGLYAQC